MSEDPASPRTLRQLQDELGYTFRDPALLELALTHESYANEQPEPLQSNERLEFLGDAVLGLVVSRYLYDRHPDLAEGSLAQMKAHLVSRKVLARKAEEMDLLRYLRLGRGERDSPFRHRRNLLADTFEALVGALYLDGKLPAARAFILKHFREAMDRMEGSRKDYKSRLQEKTQELFKSLPEYRTAGEEGPPHQKSFEVEVWFAGEVLGRGKGRSKQEAGQEAARQALEKLQELGGKGPGAQQRER